MSYSVNHISIGNSLPNIGFRTGNKYRLLEDDELEMDKVVELKRKYKELRWFYVIFL